MVFYPKDCERSEDVNIRVTDKVRVFNLSSLIFTFSLVQERDK